MKRRFQNQRLITMGVCGQIPDSLQVMMWLMTEDVPEQDYLQVFELMETADGVLICHSQEEPPYGKVVKVKCAVEPGFREKVYIIDDETHSTMLLAEEY